MADAGKYRLFEQDPITNNWLDRGWVEADGQREALRKSAQTGNYFFAVPSASFKPVRRTSREVSRWEYMEDGGTVELDSAEPVEAGAEAETSG